MKRLTKELGDILEHALEVYMDILEVEQRIKSVWLEVYSTYLDFGEDKVIFITTGLQKTAIPFVTEWESVVSTSEGIKVELPPKQTKRIFKMLKLIHNRILREKDNSRQAKEEREIAATIKYLKEHLRIP